MDYHSDRFKDHSLLVFKDEKLIAVLPGNRVDNTVYSHQGLTYGGLIVHKKSKFRDVAEAFKHILIYLESQEVKDLTLKLIPSIYHKQPSDELDYLCFKTNAERIRCDILSTRTPRNCKVSSNRMEGVKRGQKHNLKIREVDDFSTFWNAVLIPNLDRKHQAAPVHSLEEITHLKSKFPNNIRQFNVYQNDKLVAGTTIFESDLVAHSQYISANEEKNTLGSLDYLHYYLITELFHEKAYFDFGISNENDGRQINNGLQYWKEGFGARSVVQSFYKVNTANHKLLNDLML